MEKLEVRNEDFISRKREYYGGYRKCDITITGNRKAVTIIRNSPTGVQMHDLDLTDISNEFLIILYNLMIIFI
jgi:hypothetical protein